MRGWVVIAFIAVMCVIATVAQGRTDDRILEALIAVLFGVAVGLLLERRYSRRAR